MEETAGLYCVTFVGQYFNLTTTVLDARDEEDAINQAKTQIASEYGWDLDEVSDEITAVLEGTYN
jgi:hypothetical protein